MNLLPLGIVMLVLVVPATVPAQTTPAPMTVIVVPVGDAAWISWTPVPNAEAYRVYQEGIMIYEGTGTVATGDHGLPAKVYVVTPEGKEIEPAGKCIEVQPVGHWPPAVLVYEC